MSTNTVKETLNLSAPWIEFYHKVETLFDPDPNVAVVYDDATKIIKLYVDGTDKANALEKLLPKEKVFGNITVKIAVIPSNLLETKDGLIQAAFDGNPNFVEVVTAQGMHGEPQFTYVAFAAKVAQFWNDNMHDLHGNMNCLYEDLARDVIGEEIGVCFCTDELVKD